MANRQRNDPLDDSHHDLNTYTTSYPHSLRTRGQTSPYTPNRTTTLSSITSPGLPRRPAIPEEFRMTQPEHPPPTSAPMAGIADDIIDTAIVIKNIPFSYAEEDFLTKLFPELGLIPPYAFNYHRNRADGSFHGLAFANFTNPSEAMDAVNVLNNFELERRRLRVELKKRLSPEEEQRQRLERQARRQVQAQGAQSPGQISAQIRDLSLTTVPVQATSMTTQTPPTTSSERRLESLSVLDVHNLPDNLRPRVVLREPSSPTFGVDLDMNDEQTLGFYTTIQVFLSQYASTPTAALEFPPTLNSHQRRIVRSLAQKYSLETASYGTGSERYITVFKSGAGTQRTISSRLTVPITEASLPETRSFPLSRASAEQLTLSQQSSQNTLRSPLSSSSVGGGTSEQPRLRSVASMGNLRSQREGRRSEAQPPPPVPPIPYELFTPSSYDLVYDPSSSSSRGLVHRTSTESTSSSRFAFQGQGGGAPSRQPHGPPQDQSRGFTHAIRPIGHGAKTSSHGSLSHGSGASGPSQSGSRGGSDTITELGVSRGESAHSQQ